MPFFSFTGDGKQNTIWWRHDDNNENHKEDGTEDVVRHSHFPRPSAKRGDSNGAPARSGEDEQQPARQLTAGVLARPHSQGADECCHFSSDRTGGELIFIG